MMRSLACCHVVVSRGCDNCAPDCCAGDGAGEAAAQLRDSPIELADLYNDYAAHFQANLDKQQYLHLGGLLDCPWS